MVLVDSHRISPVPWYSGTLLGHSLYTYRAITFYGAAFQAASISASGPVMQALQPRCGRNHTGLGCSPFARHYLGNHYCFLFLRVLRCFSSPGSLPRAYFIQHAMTGLQPAGLPHSEIRGSMLVCSSPRLIAAYHVLHRLSMPRHPPYALPYLSSAILHASSHRLFITLSLTLYFYSLYTNTYIVCATEQSSCQRTFTRPFRTTRRKFRLNFRDPAMWS